MFIPDPNVHRFPGLLRYTSRWHESIYNDLIEDLGFQHKANGAFIRVLSSDT